MHIDRGKDCKIPVAASENELSYLKFYDEVNSLDTQLSDHPEIEWPNVNVSLYEHSFGEIRGKLKAFIIIAVFPTVETAHIQAVLMVSNNAASVVCHSGL